jgi:hypothetical protein
MYVSFSMSFKELGVLVFYHSYQIIDNNKITNQTVQPILSNCIFIAKILGKRFKVSTLNISFIPQ